MSMRTSARAGAVARIAARRARARVASGRSERGPETVIILPILSSDHFPRIEVEHKGLPYIILFRRQLERAAMGVENRPARAFRRGAEEGIGGYPHSVLDLGHADGAVRTHLYATWTEPVFRIARPGPP